MVPQLADSMAQQFKNLTLGGDLRFKDSGGQRPTLVCGDGLLPSETTLGCGQYWPSGLLNDHFQFRFKLLCCALYIREKK